MATILRVDIVSAEAQIYSGTAEMVVATGEMGEIGIMPGHSPLLTTLKPGQIRVVKSIAQTEETEETYYVSGGVLEVQPHMVTILADTVVRAVDLDEAKAEEALQHARDQLKTRQADFDYARATSDLAQAAAQIRAIQRLRKKYKH